MSEYLTKRNGVWHYQRRVPEEYAAFDKRVPVRLTTSIKVVDDKRGRKAIEIAERLNLDTEAYWRMCAGGSAEQAKLDYNAAVKRSLILDLPYLPAAAIAKEPPADLIRRIDALGTGDRVHDPDTRANHNLGRFGRILWRKAPQQRHEREVLALTDNGRRCAIQAQQRAVVGRSVSRSGDPA
ncbi:hypothetical protein AB8A20_02480 [Tardiphaga sp. 604_B6_N1_1]|uniref:hypothetical protein n=1 Tax=Tardiphaga sp. 604_B6_N1_1 TaxID=3240779 RepID=UPI003F218A7F